MQPLDGFSYQCGVIDCFCEMVKAGLKPLALSHPCGTAAERDGYLPFCGEICGQYGLFFYPEDAPLLTDLFPLSMNQGKYNILFYRRPEVLRRYRELKDQKKVLQASGVYQGPARRALALEFGALLGYPEEGSLRLIQQNKEKE